MTFLWSQLKVSLKNYEMIQNYNKLCSLLLALNCMHFLSSELTAVIMATRGGTARVDVTQIAFFLDSEYKDCYASVAISREYSYTPDNLRHARKYASKQDSISGGKDKRVLLGCLL